MGHEGSSLPYISPVPPREKCQAKVHWVACWGPSPSRKRRDGGLATLRLPSAHAPRGSAFSFACVCHHPCAQRHGQKLDGMGGREPVDHDPARRGGRRCPGLWELAGRREPAVQFTRGTQTGAEGPLVFTLIYFSQGTGPGRTHPENRKDDYAKTNPPLAPLGG
uniref:Uncharacterized protein n=1 Tax=Molossus molossus TaxID=27622 RepID=A0A7J8BJ82_MOLMO|nr:hypothetical protein HJG59_010451 [Molossus molossus]